MKKSNDLKQKPPLEIADAVWDKIYPILTGYSGIYIGDPQRCRLFLSAVFWMAKEGTSWRMLPEAYGNSNAVYRRFSRWCDTGVFESLQTAFQGDVEISAILVDSTSVRAHACAAGAEKKKVDKPHKL